MHNDMIVIVDDEKEITSSYEIFMRREGHRNYALYNDPLKFLEDLPGLYPAVLFLDLRMPGVSGEELLEKIREERSNTSIFIVSGTEDVETAVRCIKNGALDYLVKPIDKSRFQTAILKGLEVYSVKAELDKVKASLAKSGSAVNPNFSHIITRNKDMRALFSYLEAVAEGVSSVLITGETGTGKELFAEAVHKCSGRKGGYVTVNVSALDENMFNDTLFGHVKGAFTGADRERRGLLMTASGGTVFLDEIGDLAEASQIKLLRVLQNMEFMPIGSDKPQKTTARIIAATHADLAKKVQEGTFRQDLYYRLKVHNISILPLRDRKDDIELLFYHFYKKHTGDSEIDESSVPAELVTSLKMHSFPGNVRELEALVADYTAVFKNRKPSAAEIKRFLRSHNIKTGTSSTETEIFKYEGGFPTLKEMELKLIESALEKTKGNQSRAAAMLGISRQALNKRLNSQGNL